VPLLVIPCYQPYLPRIDGDESFYQATLYGSIFPAVWNFQQALHARGYGTCITTQHLHREEEVRQLLGIPQGYVRGCLLPVGRLRAGHTFQPARRRPIDEVVARDGQDGRALEWVPRRFVQCISFAGSDSLYQRFGSAGGRMRMFANSRSSGLAHR
jgi:hypothetical protein